MHLEHLRDIKDQTDIGEWRLQLGTPQVDIDIDIDNIYSTYSNWLHIVFMQHNHLKKKNNIK